MSELRLEDVWDLVRIGVLLFFVYAALRALYEYRAQIALFIGAIWRRYVAVDDWRAAMERLADERESVRDYQEGRHAADVMSSTENGSEPVPLIDRSGSGRPERSLENQESRVPVRSLDDVIDLLSEHNFAGDERLIDVLAVLQRDGEPVISANKIRDHVGGTDAAVKARVAKRRPKSATPKPSPRLDRPANGW